MRSINNDQNINRVCAKMSEGFHDETNAKLSKRVKSLEYFQDINATREEISDEDINVNDHMYASNTEDDGVNETSSPDLSCQTAESEVKFLKEWLILHTDLVQQQNDDIIDKDREIYLLRKENEMLKERINCIEKGTPFQIEKFFNRKVAEDSENVLSEDMTQGSCKEDAKENIEIIGEQYCDNENCSIEVLNFHENHVDLSDSESQIDSVVGNDTSYIADDSELGLKSEDYILNELSDSYKSESDIINCNSSISDYNFTINNISESDPMKNIRMSIRRKRVCSNSSALSQNESPIVEERQTYRRFKKKKRRVTKDIQFLTSSEAYVTQAHEVNLGISSSEPDISELSATTLEVPRWRHKIYASCYTMEGTENLDDEVYNKRHMRLENDERRRKRWDVQRIREQRVIEKLKQRQERIGSGSKGEDNEPLPSLWPKVEDIKFLEVSEELPVAAFGMAVPNIPPSEFNLPWLSNPAILTRKPHSRRSNVKRKSSKR
ncbi:hypothetical protein NQ315_005463 [Exocentrus adspersus]|uniref:PEHE domain-containing protein n=1 Tax=Exocentrus adspersus TaxID=1586481 RepID=A0AAV8VSW1_9CUCU|nr:hypothetical protein NQ315_005463 [Exocentrus adspersus]